MATKTTTTKVAAPKLAAASRALGTKLAPKAAKVSKAKPAKAKAANPDIIISSVGAQGSNAIVVSTASRNVTVQPWQDTPATRKLYAAGQSLGALKAHLAAMVKPTAKLANGLDGRSAPHSAKAVSDQRTPAKGAAKATKAAAPKAAKAKAAHAKSGKFSANKLDFNWANAQGYIVFAK